ncbi:T9SS type A sorting domain-containing protein [bacterium]|nr:T9SS type A sorting domain-containing protein [bacterium]
MVSMTSFSSLLMSYAFDFIPIGLSLIVQSTVIIATGLIVRYVLRRKSAAFQSLILRMTLVAVVLSPILTILLNNAGVRRVVIPVPLVANNAVFSKTDVTRSVNTDTGKENGSSYPRSQPADNSGILRQSVTVSPGDSRGHSTDAHPMKETPSAIKSNEGRVSDASSRPLQQNLPQDDNGATAPSFPTDETGRNDRGFLAGLYVTVFVLWAGTSIFFFLKIFIVFLCINYIRYSARPAKFSYRVMCGEAAASLGITVPPVLQHPVAKGAFICGYFRPAVMLPGYDNECFTATKEVFLHELAHLARFDHLWNFLHHMAIVFLPVQPLLWRLIRTISDVSDYACDDYVVQYSGDNHSYAIQLFTIARTYNPGVPEATAGVGILSKPSPLYDRIERILDTSYVRLIKVRAFELVSVIFFFFSSLTVTGFVGFKGEHGNGRRMVVNTDRQNIERIITIRPDNTAENTVRPGLSSKKTTFFHAAVPETKETGKKLPDVTRDDSQVNSGSIQPGWNMISEIDNPERNRIPAPDDAGAMLVFNSTNNAGQKDVPQNDSFSSETGMAQPLPSVTDERETGADSAPQTAESSSGEAVADIRFDVTGHPESWSRSTSTLDQSRASNFTLKPIQIVIPVDYQHTEPQNPEEELLFDMYRSLEKNKLYPVWSPDGSQIVITDRIYGIWMVPVQGGEPALIYRNDPVRYHDVTVRLTGIEPLCFAPGGRELTYKRYIIDEDMGSEVIIDKSTSPPHMTIMNPVPVIEMVDIETGRTQVLAKGAAYGRWSSDGRLFLYTRLDAESFKELMIRDVYTGNEYPIDEFAAQQIQLSPNDRYLMFNEDDLFMLPGTGDLKRFSLSGGVTFSDVSRDARWILYTYRGSLFVYDTHDEKAIDLFPEEYISPNWARFSPDLSSICFSLESEKNGWEIYLYDFSKITSETGVQEAAAPVAFGLKDNFPNPFNSSTTIQFSLPERATASMVIYNIMGQRVRELVSGMAEPGIHSVVWDGRDDSGRTVGTGTYITRLIAGNHHAVIRMTLVK